MFTLYFLRYCYGRRVYLLGVLTVLDVIAGFYTGGIQHPYTRHMFLHYDLLSGLSNILYWIIFFLPIGDSIVQEKSCFGVSLLCRISKSKYILKKYVALFAYCISFFGISIVISYIVSYFNGYGVGSIDDILFVYIILVLFGCLLLELVHMTAWFTNSSYAMTSIYVGLVAALQTPAVQERISINVFTRNMVQSVLCIVGVTVTVIFGIVFLMNRKDCIGMKKGISI